MSKPLSYSGKFDTSGYRKAQLTPTGSRRIYNQKSALLDSIRKEHKYDDDIAENHQRILEMESEQNEIAPIAHPLKILISQGPPYYVKDKLI